MSGYAITQETAKCKNRGEVVREAQVVARVHLAPGQTKVWHHPLADADAYFQLKSGR